MIRIDNFKNVKKLIILYFGEYSKINTKEFHSKVIRGKERVYKYKKSLDSVNFEERGIEIVCYEKEYPDFDFLIEKIKDGFLEYGNVLILNSNLKSIIDLRFNIELFNLEFMTEESIRNFLETTPFNWMVNDLLLKNIINYEELKTTNGIKRSCVDCNKIIDIIFKYKSFISIDLKDVNNSYLRKYIKRINNKNGKIIYLKGDKNEL